MQPHAPSGLFPAGFRRSSWREPHPVRVRAVLGGAGATLAWLLLFGLLATSVRAYVWLTLGAGLVAWLIALWLGRAGDRGAATGVALVTAVGVGVAVVVLVIRWISSGWPLW
jgi:hypothetical protein